MLIVLLFISKAPSPPLEYIRVMMIVWRLRGNIIRTASCWIVLHNVHSQQHTYEQFLQVQQIVCHSGSGHFMLCIELYYCNMMEWFWWDSSLISMKLTGFSRP